MNQNLCGIVYYAMLYPISGRLKVLGFYSYDNDNDNENSFIVMNYIVQ